MNLGEAFAVGFVIGLCIIALRVMFGYYEARVGTILAYSAATFVTMAVILVLIPSLEDKGVLLAYIIASTTGFTMMGDSLIAMYLVGYSTKR